MLKKIKTWLSTSNRYKHLIGGILIGLFAFSWYCAIYTGCGIAGAMEMKDKMWGGKFDWVDFICTVVGAIIGRSIICIGCIIF